MMKISMASVNAVSTQSLKSSDKRTPKEMVTIAVKLTIRVIASNTRKMINPYNNKSGWLG